METLEIIAAVISVVGIGVYHVYLFARHRRHPETTAVGITNRLRRQWVQSIMEDRRDILAIQTLRNVVMASSFLASTAILIALGILNAAVRPSPEISRMFGLIETGDESLWFIKMMLLVVQFFLAFFNFTLAIRYFNHASFGLGLPDQPDGPASHEFVAEVVNHGGLHYTLGMRCYYLAIPLALWIFSPFLMLAGTVILITVLNRLDRTV